MKLEAPQRNRMLVFMAFVCAMVVLIGWANQKIKVREQGSASGKAIRDKLKLLESEGLKWSLTAVPGPLTERPMRAEWRWVLPGDVDVLVLGQSDANHMSGTFFKEPRRFYNGFISGSLIAYHWELLDMLEQAGVTPKIVLWDFRSGHVLVQHPEPAYDAPVTEIAWWAGVPYFHGEQVPAWYKDIPSLLSLAQTEFTLRTLIADLKTRNTTIVAGADDGTAYVLLPAEKPSISHRWLADGSRVYPNEENGKIVPRGQPGIEEARGERSLNEVSFKVLEGFLRQMKAKGVKVIVYAPPISALAVEDKTQTQYYEAFDKRTRQATEPLDVDFCDLTVLGAKIGCGVEDYYDELHISRHCNERVLHELVTGCAPRLGPELRTYVTDAVIAGPPSAGAK